MQWQVQSKIWKYDKIQSFFWFYFYFMVDYPNDMDKRQSSLVQLRRRPDTFQNHISLLQIFHFSSLSYSGPSGSMEKIS